MSKKLFLVVLSTIIFSLSSIAFAQDKKTSPKVPKRISGGVVNGKAISLPKPKYPFGAYIKGNVNVAIVIDTEGNVMSAEAVSGHPLLRASSVSAARHSKFQPILLSGIPVEVSGVIVYNFGTPPDWTSVGMDFGFAEMKGMSLNLHLLDGFENEQTQIDSLAEDSVENQKAQLPLIASTIRSKLSPVERWRFEFGIANAKTLFALSNSEASAVLQSLEAFRTLAINPPSEIENYLVERINKIIEFADKGRFNKEDKENLTYYVQP